MSEALDRAFRALDERLSREHGSKREELLSRLDAPRPEPAPGRRRALLQAACAFVAAGLGAALAAWLWRADDGALWAAGPSYELEVEAEESENGVVVSRFRLFSRGGGKERKALASPTLAVARGRSASVFVGDPKGAGIEIQQVFATEADKVLVVAVVKDAAGDIVWTTAMAVSIAK
jgi:hypothetical protein